MQDMGHDWHHYLHLTADQYEALEALRQSLSEVRDLDLTKYLTNLEALSAELGLRFEQTERILSRQEPTEIPHHLAVALDDAATSALPPFQEAAVRVIKTQLEKLEEVSLALYDSMAKIRGYERPAGAHDDHHGHGAEGHGLALDPFRLRNTFAFVAAVWVAYLLWVFIYDVPRGSLFTCFVVITASIATYRPEANLLAYASGWLVGALAAGPMYVILMHQVTDYLSFAAMVVVAIFILQYALYPHVHPIARIFVSIGFVIAIDAESHQHYDFQHYVETVIWMATMIGVTVAVRLAILPRRPDVAFMQTLDQFFRHADFLLSAHDAEGRPDRSLARRVRSIFYRHSLLEEAERLALFGGQVKPETGQTTYRMTRGATPEQMQELVRTVSALGHRIEALMAARAAWQSNAVDLHVMDEKRDWLDATQEWFRRRPGTAQLTGPDGDLQARLARLETRIDEAIARIGEGELKTEDYENFYHRLGHYRGLSEAVGEYARVASAFDWPRWREVRF